MLAQVASHGSVMAWPWRHDSRDVEPAVPARLGREAGTAVGHTGDGMGLGCLGTPVCGLARGPPGAPEEVDTLKNWGKGNGPRDPAQSLALSHP